MMRSSEFNQAPPPLERPPELAPPMPETTPAPAEFYTPPERETYSELGGERAKTGGREGQQSRQQEQRRQSRRSGMSAGQSALRFAALGVSAVTVTASVSAAAGGEFAQWITETAQSAYVALAQPMVTPENGIPLDITFDGWNFDFFGQSAENEPDQSGGDLGGTSTGSPNGGTGNGGEGLSAGALAMEQAEQGGEENAPPPDQTPPEETDPTDPPAQEETREETPEPPEESQAPEPEPSDEPEQEPEPEETPEEPAEEPDEASDEEPAEEPAEEEPSEEGETGADGSETVVLENGVTTTIPGFVHVHSHQSVVTAATCTEEGVTTYTCSCGDTYSEPIPATGHSWDGGVVTAPATCTVAGVKTFTCGNCNGIRTEAVAATGHTSVTLNAVAATCEEAGLTEGSQCSVCGTILTAQTTIPALEHSWDGGVVTTEPTCTVAGVKTFTCGNCNDTRTETVPAAHTYEGGLCTVCGDILPPTNLPVITAATYGTVFMDTEHGNVLRLKTVWNYTWDQAGDAGKLRFAICYAGGTADAEVGTGGSVELVIPSGSMAASGGQFYLQTYYVVTAADGTEHSLEVGTPYSFAVPGSSDDWTTVGQTVNFGSASDSNSIALTSATLTPTNGSRSAASVTIAAQWDGSEDAIGVLVSLTSVSPSLSAQIPISTTGQSLSASALFTELIGTNTVPCGNHTIKLTCISLADGSTLTPTETVSCTLVVQHTDTNSDGICEQCSAVRPVLTVTTHNNSSRATWSMTKDGEEYHLTGAADHAMYLEYRASEGDVWTSLGNIFADPGYAAFKLSGQYRYHYVGTVDGWKIDVTDTSYVTYTST